MNATLGAKLGVGLTALIYLGLGLGLLAMPAELIAGVGIDAATPEARAEIRAMYGGLELGIGAWLLISLRHAERLGPALLFVALSLGGLGAGRLSGLLIEGTGWAAHAPFLASELIGASVASALLLWLRASER